MTTRRYVDRSRYETTQACRRRRWWEYEEGGRGITSAKKPLPLAVGGAVHEGLAVLLREGQSAMDGPGALTPVGWRQIEDNAVAAALADFAQFQSALALDVNEAPAVEVSEYDKYLYAEQAALVEGMVRAYARRRLRPLLEQFMVLEVEREGQWKLGEGGSDGCRECLDPPVDAYELWFMSRPDALLLERASNQLYLQSFKTTSGWDVRRARDAEHDMQGLSEGVEIEKRLAVWWGLRDVNSVMGDGCTLAIHAYLKTLAAPPRILGIRYEYLLKGERWRDKDLAARFGFDARAQRSVLTHGYLNAGMAAGDEQWNCSYDYMKPDGTGETSKLYAKNWRSTPVWEHLATAEWIRRLDESAMAVSGDTGAELGYKSEAQATGYLPTHPLDDVFLPPVVVYRQEDDLRDLVEQMEAQEVSVAQGVEAVQAAADEGSHRSLLNRHFPQTRRACEFPSQCPFVKLCYGGEDLRRDPVGSGLYRIRVPNHPQEAGDATATATRP